MKNENEKPGIFHMMIRAISTPPPPKSDSKKKKHIKKKNKKNE